MSDEFSVTIEHLREAAGGVHRNTILAWERAGLLAGLRTSRTSHHRSGVRKFWQADALARVREIARLKAARYSNEAILTALANGA